MKIKTVLGKRKLEITDDVSGGKKDSLPYIWVGVTNEGVEHSGVVEKPADLEKLVKMCRRILREKGANKFIQENPE